ncbi:MAG: hypothetical protein M3Y65_14430 [Pseudomonadota bacterium]|nr:hypothetical protein [Pseudomonadota bacterium]
MQILQQLHPSPLVRTARIFAGERFMALCLLQIGTIACKNNTFKHASGRFSDAQLQLLKVKAMMFVVVLFLNFLLF